MTLQEPRSAAKVIAASLQLFFALKEKQHTGRFDKLALSSLCAPTFYLADEKKLIAPWIERAPGLPQIERDICVLPKRMRYRTVYLGSDFFLTMLTTLERKRAPRSRDIRSSEKIISHASEGNITLVTSAAEFFRFAGIGGALVEARDQNHFSELLEIFRSKGDLSSFGGPKIASRMKYLRNLGIRIIPAELEDYIGACEFIRNGSGTSFTTLLGLRTLAQVTPGDAVMLRFLSRPGHAAMLVWQEFSEDGTLVQMSSLDANARV